MGMNIFSCVIMLLGFSIIILGLIIWKKQKINFIYGYNSRNVKKEDIKGYTESTGKAYIISGISTLLVIILRLTDNDIYDYIDLIACFLGLIISIVKIVKTQKKYKAGIWS